MSSYPCHHSGHRTILLILPLIPRRPVVLDFIRRQTVHPPSCRERRRLASKPSVISRMKALGPAACNLHRIERAGNPVSPSLIVRLCSFIPVSHTHCLLNSLFSIQSLLSVPSYTTASAHYAATATQRRPTSKPCLVRLARR
ncbi:hypothetical protein IG631_03362 [Alternaria alternata]|nr:hypothetical protein IG631_03362 [Alternaria alternata]